MEIQTGGGYWGIYTNSAFYLSAVPVQPNVTTAVTAEADFGASSGGQDRIRFWVQTTGPYCNPATASCSPALDVSAAPMDKWTGVSWEILGKDSIVVDEISVDRLAAHGRLCVLKFDDANGDGVQDNGEHSLPHWIFTIDTAPPTTLTSAATPVCIALPVGTYTVTETHKAGWVATNPRSGSETVHIRRWRTVQLAFGNQHRVGARRD